MTLKPTDMLEIQSAIDEYERKFPRRPAPSAEVALAWRLGKKEWARRQAARMLGSQMLLTSPRVARRHLIQYLRSKNATGSCGPGNNFGFGGLPLQKIPRKLAAPGFKKRCWLAGGGWSRSWSPQSLSLARLLAVSSECQAGSLAIRLRACSRRNLAWRPCMHSVPFVNILPSNMANPAPAPRLAPAGRVGLCPVDVSARTAGRLPWQIRWRLAAGAFPLDPGLPARGSCFAQAVRRLTRVDARSVEQSVNLDDGDEIYNWPWLYAVQVGEWGLTEAQAKKLRDYLLRGGFFMADDFHGSEEQAYFEKTMKMVFPERPIVDIPNDDPIFHTVFDLDDRYRITGAEHLDTGYKKDGKVARWQGIYDDKGRVMVAISLNSDIGDSWEWSDTPRYPLKFSDLGIRIGVNYVVYAMTH